MYACLHPCGDLCFAAADLHTSRTQYQEANGAHVACVQADHQYTRRELSSVKATLQKRNNDLQDLESLVQDQDSAACEPYMPPDTEHHDA